jgi:hypothetical protein
VKITGKVADYHGRRFCPTCGASVFGQTTEDEIELHVGCFDEPNQLKPTYEIWVWRREDWLPPFDVTRRYEGDRKGKGRPEL